VTKIFTKKHCPFRNKLVYRESILLALDRATAWAASNRVFIRVLPEQRGVSDDQIPWPTT
jgi:hypothetical protein